VGERSDQVRRWWSLLEGEDGVRRFLAEVPDDVEWSPLSVDHVLRGKAALREYLLTAWGQQPGFEASAFSFVEAGRAVIVTGRLRRYSADGFSEGQPAWVYFFGEDGELRRAVGYRSHAEALEAAKG
jgi:hypothetical protein